MRHIINGGQVAALGVMGVVVMGALTGCEQKQEQQQTQQQTQGNKFFVIQQEDNGKYTVVEEHPTEGPTRAIIRDKDGNERFMNQEELEKLAQQEYEKVENGTSEVTAAPTEDAGMGLGGTILAAAAGALLGNMIANKLMNNQNFQQRSQMNNRSAYSRSANSRATSSKSSSNKRSFFGSKGSSTTSPQSSSKSTSYGG